jgi:sugar phosphate isomerase/epimerase
MNRRYFLSSMAAGLTLTSFKSKPNLCFSTLGCPNWNWLKIISKAKQYGYGGIEIRGILDEIDILKSPVFSKSNLKGSKRLAEENGVKIVNLNPSSNLHETNSVKRKENIDEVKRYIDLAVELDSPFVRVFPDKFAFENDKEKSLKLISDGLAELGEYCDGSGVKILLDAHGDLVYSEDIKGVMKVQNPKATGIIWDYFNMHLKSGESETVMVDILHEYIKFVQIKDGHFLENEKYEYVLPGEGEAPVSKILEALNKVSYKGFISLEWEKRWHPELPDLEQALPLFRELISN